MKKLDPIPCRFCFKEFDPVVFFQRFCSDRCRNAYHYERTKKTMALGKAVLDKQIRDGETSEDMSATTGGA